MIKELPEMIQKCVCKIDQLQEEYNSMTKEDTEYHHKQNLDNNK